MKLARDIFFEKLLKDSDVYIVSSDYAPKIFDDYRRKNPQKMVRVGIAEQNMISVASGISSTGRCVVACAVNPFAYNRAYDQIKNAVSVMKTPITVVGISEGLDQADFSSTHFATDEFSVLSTIPLLNNVSVSDNCLAEYVAGEVLKNSSSFFITISKSVNFEFGEITKEIWEKGFRIKRRNSKKAVVTRGQMLNTVVDVVDLHNFNIDIIDVFCVREKYLEKELVAYDDIIVCEEQIRDHGLGSYIKNKLYGSNIRIEQVAVDYSNGFPDEYGDREYFLRKLGIDSETIGEKIAAFLE